MMMSLHYWKCGLEFDVDSVSSCDSCRVWSLWRSQMTTPVRVWMQIMGQDKWRWLFLWCRLNMKTLRRRYRSPNLSVHLSQACGSRWNSINSRGFFFMLSFSFSMVPVSPRGENETKGSKPKLRYETSSIQKHPHVLCCRFFRDDRAVVDRGHHVCVLVHLCSTVLRTH